MSTSDKPSGKARIAFDLPDSWYHWVSLPFYQCPFIHCRLMMEGFDGVLMTELTHDGLTDLVFPNKTIDEVEFQDKTDSVLCYDFEIPYYDMTEIVFAIDRIRKLRLRWSNWFTGDYIMGRNFPSLTCASYIAHLLKLPSCVETPRDLIDYLSRLEGEQ